MLHEFSTSTKHLNSVASRRGVSLLEDKWEDVEKSFAPLKWMLLIYIYSRASRVIIARNDDKSVDNAGESVRAHGDPMLIKGISCKNYPP
jgi:hypothetical protein